MLPNSFIEVFKLVRDSIVLPFNYGYDFYRYIRYSSTFSKLNNKNKVRALLIKDFHVIEKGLSLSKPRPGFGQVVVKRVIRYTALYIENYGVDSVVISSLNALIEYQRFNKKNDLCIQWLDVFLNNVSHVLASNQSETGGTINISRSEILEKSSGCFEDLANTRHSIRVFDVTPVSSEILKKAAIIARKTPSVCNRQTSHIFIFEDNKIKEDILSLQGGNRGFGDMASHIVAITSDLNCFSGANERNQAYVDGGLMAMTFVYALHSLGVGTCFLNWSVTSGVDRSLKKVANIPSSHVVISLLAVGNIPPDLKVACSARIDINEMLHFVK
ncbi:MAG: nitroreductase family protein [Methyloprofundus sp.]|nr:nitroreductase family protein [Methyloprofundus sp.]